MSSHTLSTTTTGSSIPVGKYAELYWKFEESLERGELDEYLDFLARELSSCLPAARAAGASTSGGNR